VAVSYEHGDEPSGSSATDLVAYHLQLGDEELASGD
jgi:hypothetical protein